MRLKRAKRERKKENDKLEYILQMKKWFSIQKYIDIIHHINRFKEKYNMIICNDTQKSFDRIQY